MASKLGLTAQEERDLRVVFRVFDTTDCGMLDAEDLRRSLKVLGFRPSRRVLGEMSQAVDVQGTAKGTVSFEGFMEIVVRLQGTSYDSHGEIVQAFNYMDCDGDQMLSIEDLKRVCSQTGLKLSEADLQAMLEEADRDGDGLISQQEFVQVMCRTNLFSQPALS